MSQALLSYTPPPSPEREPFLGRLPPRVSVGGWGWSGGACWVNFQCRGVLLVWMIVGQGPIVLAVGAEGGLFGWMDV